MPTLCGFVNAMPHNPKHRKAALAGWPVLLSPPKGGEKLVRIGYVYLGEPQVGLSAENGGLPAPRGARPTYPVQNRDKLSNWP